MEKGDEGEINGETRLLYFPLGSGIRMGKFLIPGDPSTIFFDSWMQDPMSHVP